jgi:hypothetical protein
MVRFDFEHMSLEELEAVIELGKEYGFEDEDEDEDDEPSSRTAA